MIPVIYQGQNECNVLLRQSKGFHKAVIHYVIWEMIYLGVYVKDVLVILY